MKGNSLNLKVFSNADLVKGQGNKSKIALSEGLKHFIDALVEEMMTKVLKEREGLNGGGTK